MTPGQAAREQAGLSIAQVARRTGYHESAIRKAESGGVSVSYNLATRLAREYRCRAEVFLYRRSRRARG